jgi:hypothetical protein
MATRHERVEREADPSGVSLVGFSVWSGAEGVVIDTVLHNDVVRRFQAYELDFVKVLAQFRRADELDADAAYYRHRATQQEQARGLGYYVGLLRALASDRAAMAQRLRTGNEAT